MISIKIRKRTKIKEIKKLKKNLDLVKEEKAHYIKNHLENLQNQVKIIMTYIKKLLIIRMKLNKNSASDLEKRKKIIINIVIIEIKILKKIIIKY